MQEPIIKLDLHRMTRPQAKVAIDSALRRADSGTYRICVIHGSHGGDILQTMVRKTYGRHPKVLRMECGEGVTDLILREF